MSEQTAVNGVSITLGDTILTVEDLNKPLWYGDYYGGKLAIYLGKAEPSIIPDCTSIVIVFTSIAGQEAVMVAHYETDVPPEDIVAHIQANTIIAYHKTKADAEVALANLHQAPDKLQ